MGFGGEGGSRGAEGAVDVGGGEAGVLESGLGGVEADGAVGEGGCGEANFLDGLIMEKGYCCESCLGDGLGVAGSYFADEVLVGGVDAGEGDAVEELSGAEGGALVA